MSYLRTLLNLPPEGLSWQRWRARAAREAAQAAQAAQAAERQRSLTPADRSSRPPNGAHAERGPLAPVAPAGRLPAGPPVEGPRPPQGRPTGAPGAGTWSRTPGGTRPPIWWEHQPTGSPADAGPPQPPTPLATQHAGVPPQTVSAARTAPTEHPPTDFDSIDPATGSEPQSQPAPSAPSTLSADPPPWAPDEDPAGRKLWATALRVLLALVLLFVIGTGIRAIFWPYGFGGKPAVTGTNPTGDFPTGEAAATAARFAGAYLTWDERNRDLRAKAITLDLAAGLDATVGWNGEGVQTVRGIYPGQVTVDASGRTGHVVVLAWVVPYKEVGAKWVEQPPVWHRLSVPVERGATRLVVSGPPAYVAESPNSITRDDPQPSEPDVELTTRTEPDAAAFFEAYATSDSATSAIAASSAQIPSLDGAVRLKALKAWTVEAGSADRRTAAATVVWQLTGTGTELEQNYRLTLLRSTAADGTERWQVAELLNDT
jgi:hypothetical protein